MFRRWAMGCSALQCIAVCHSVSQCVAVCRSVSQCVAVCCSALQCVVIFVFLEMSTVTEFFGDECRDRNITPCVVTCVALCCTVLQCVALSVWNITPQHARHGATMVHAFFRVCCSMLQSCCSAVQCVAVCGRCVAVRLYCILQSQIRWLERMHQRQRFSST